MIFLKGLLEVNIMYKTQILHRGNNINKLSTLTIWLAQIFKIIFECMPRIITFINTHISKQLKLPNHRIKVKCKRFLSALLFPVFFDKNAMLRIFELCIQGNRKQSLMLKEAIHISFSQLHLFLRNQPQTFQQHFTNFFYKKLKSVS